MAAKKGSEMLSILEGIEISVGNKKKPKLTTWTDREMCDMFTYGLPALDSASNCGGSPRGRVIEIYGPESCGKSYTALKMIAAFQAAGENVCLIDVEHSFWGPWAAQQGVDINKLVYGQNFTSGEQAMDYAKEVCKTGKFALVVIDSIAALLPKAESESEFTDNARVGAHAAMMSRTLRVVQDEASKTDTTLVCINQTRTKIGGYGDPEETPGGKALKFYATHRISLRRVGIEKGKVDGTEKPIGIRTKVKFVKNKTGQPFGEDEFVIYFAAGSNTPIVQLVNLAIRLKVVGGRKASEEDEDIKHYHWKVDGDLVDTGCGSAADLAEWFEAQDLVLDVLNMVEAKAKEKVVEVPEEVTAIRTSLVQKKVDPEAEEKAE